MKLFQKFKLYGFRDYPSWIADYISSKLQILVVSNNFRQKRSFINKTLKHNLHIRKITYDLFDFEYQVNNRNVLFRARFKDSDFDVFKQVVINKEYLPLVNLIKQHNITPKNLIDLGANVGYTSLYLSAYFNFEEIIAVEPNSESFKLLDQNLYASSFIYKYTLEKRGVWSKTTKLSVNHKFRDGKSWSYSLTEDKKNGIIPVISFKELLENHGIKHIDILKIDIEGAESELFSDPIIMKDILGKTKFIAMEIHDEFNNREQIELFLINCNFHCVQYGELTIGFNSGI